MPNWKNGDEYEHVTQLSHHELAWEFLKRNSEYRDDWQSVAEVAATLIAKYGPFEDWLELRFADLMYEDSAWVYFPPRLPEESAFEWNARVRMQASNPRRVLLPVHAGTKWSLRCLVDPNAITRTAEFTTWGISAPIWTKYTDLWSIPVEATESLGKTLYTYIDLAADLGPQFNALKRQARQMQDELVLQGAVGPIERFRVRATHYPMYLRVLDANAQGVQIKEIVEELGLDDKDPDFNGSHQVRAWLKAAQELVAGGYIKLVK